MKKTYFKIFKKLFSIGYMVVPFLFTSIISCEDFVEIEPPRTELVKEDVFANDVTVRAAISGIYVDLFEADAFTDLLSLIAGLSADELVLFGGGARPEDQFFQNNISPLNDGISGQWNLSYNLIFQANLIIEGLEGNDNITPELRNQVEGEARFLRAYIHFYLANLWGDVPLVESSDVETNSLLERTSEALIYDKVIQDLILAKDLLAEDYSFSNGERARANKAAASALLARVYLMNGEWALAEMEASEVINNGLYSMVSDLSQAFLINSDETILEIRSTLQQGINVQEANSFILVAPPTLGGVALSVSLQQDLVDAFEEGDNRFLNWVGSVEGEGTFFFPFKYKVRSDNNPPITEALKVFRLSEQYLIRSEARARLNNIVGAQNDLNVVRNRAGLGNMTANDQNSLLTAILQERRVELFTEGAFRWLDLRRFGEIDAVLGSLKPGWESTDALYPIPQLELDRNPNLEPQNPGY